MGKDQLSELPHRGPNLGRVSSPVFTDNNPRRGSLEGGEDRPNLGRMSVGASKVPPALARLSAQGPALARNSVSGAPNLGRVSGAPALGRVSASAKQRASLELSRRSVYVESAKITVEIMHDAAEPQPIMFKNDGARFAKPNTLKMVAGQSYKFVVRTTPFLSATQGVMTMNYINDLGYMAYDAIDMTIENEAGAAHQQYSGSWKCSMAPSYKGQRYTMVLHLELEQLGEVVMEVGVKTYKPSDNKVKNGSGLKRILYNVTKAASGTRIKSEQYVSDV